jgi:hypothetical protein
VEAGTRARGATPVHAPLAGLRIDAADHHLALYELVGDERRATPAQIEPGVVPRLWWILEGETRAGDTRRYELRAEPGPAPGAVPHQGSLRDDGDSLTLGLGDAPVVRYRYAHLEAPPGESRLYRRSGFLHPLWSPAGEVLTRVQPPDHHHHVGNWNPWTRTEYDGRQLDFWNLDEAQGTVRFASFLSRVAGPVYAGFRSRLEHVDLTAPAPEGALVSSSLILSCPAVWMV